MKNAYNVALADFFHPPVIHSVEQVDASLRIRASDDVKVARVSVTVFDGDGKVLEKGEATQLDQAFWRYDPQHQGRLLVEARDLPGNVVRWDGESGNRG